MYSTREREEAVRLREAGHTIGDIARELGMGERTVVSIMREYGLAGTAPSRKVADRNDWESLAIQYGRIEVRHYGTAGQPGSGFAVTIGSKQGYGRTLADAKTSALAKHKGIAS